MIQFSGVSEPICFKRVDQLDGVITLSWLDFTIDRPCVKVASRRCLTSRNNKFDVFSEIHLLRDGVEVPAYIIINNKGDIIIDNAKYCDLVMAGTVVY